MFLICEVLYLCVQAHGGQNGHSLPPEVFEPDSDQPHPGHAALSPNKAPEPDPQHGEGGAGVQEVQT